MYSQLYAQKIVGALKIELFFFLAFDKFFNTLRTFLETFQRLLKEIVLIFLLYFLLYFYYKFYYIICSYHDFELLVINFRCIASNLDRTVSKAAILSVMRKFFYNFLTLVKRIFSSFPNFFPVNRMSYDHRKSIEIGILKTFMWKIFL